jgi:cytochrome c peroxidase
MWGVRLSCAVWSIGITAWLAACGDSTPAVEPSRDAGSDDAEQSDAGGDQGGDDDDLLNLPSDFPPPVIPEDNPLTAEKVELGRHLFYDKRLSGNETQACASCHQQKLAFTDGRATALGSTGEAHPRASMSLANVLYSATLNWAAPDLVDLESQALLPILGDTPVELGLADMQDVLIARLSAEEKYQDLFPAAFPEDADPFSLDNVARALASFERTLISGNSPFDHYTRDTDDAAISESAKRGSVLFFSETFDCFHCHGGITFSDQVNHANLPSGESPFHNTGLYNLDLEGSYPEGNQGLYEVTGNRRDKGRFKAPSLRNIAVTAPYMHDGSIETLEEVLDHYAVGGRTLSDGPYAGRGFDNPNKSIFVHGFAATDEERADLIAFLNSLTDEAFLTNPKFSNPW